MVAISIEPLTVSAILEARVRAAWRGESHRLSIFDVTNACARAAWYALHWASPPEQHDGPRLRSFKRRRDAASELIDDLTAAGVKVQSHDPDTWKPFEAAVAGGHVVAKISGRATGVPESPKREHAVLAKGLDDKAFGKLCKEGLASARPTDHLTLQVYMAANGLTRGLFLASNLNDDSVFAERIEVDPVAAAHLAAHAETVVSVQQPPERLHDDPTSRMAFACGRCRHAGLCHYGGFARRNCRTCLHATPEMDGAARWSCARHGRDLTPEELAAGCAAHLYIPALVPGEQVDAHEGEEWVAYRLADGSIWRDGAEATGGTDGTHR